MANLGNRTPNGKPQHNGLVHTLFFGLDFGITVWSLCA